MLKEWEKAEKPDDEELSERLKKARLELAGRQMAIKEKKLPVLVIMDGWGGAGKGGVLGALWRLGEKMNAGLETGFDMYY